MKVWCVFESSEHTDIYERDNDGDCLVAIFSDRKKAWAKVGKLFNNLDFDQSTGDIEIKKFEYIEVTERDSTDNHGVECVWKWHIKEMEVYGADNSEEVLDYEIRVDRTDDGWTVYDVYAQYDGDSEYRETFQSRENAEEYIEELCNSDEIDITNDGYAFERQVDIVEDPEACQEDS